MNEKNLYLASQAQQVFEQKLNLEVKVEKIHAVCHNGTIFFIAYEEVYHASAGKLTNLNSHHVAIVEALSSKECAPKIDELKDYFEIDSSHHFNLSRTEWRYERTEDGNDFELISQDSYLHRQRQKKNLAQTEKV